MIGASVTDYGAVWAQDHLRKSLGLAGARVLELELAIPKAPDRFDRDVGHFQVAPRKLAESGAG